MQSGCSACVPTGLLAVLPLSRPPALTYGKQAGRLYGNLACLMRNMTAGNPASHPDCKPACQQANWQAGQPAD
jgi:hypothetical protein